MVSVDICVINGKRKIDEVEIDGNEQNDSIEQLTELRSQILEKIRNGESIENLFENNPLLHAGKNMKSNIDEFQMSEKCIVCKESWFEQALCHAPLLPLEWHSGMALDAGAWR